MHCSTGLLVALMFLAGVGIYVDQAPKTWQDGICQVEQTKAEKTCDDLYAPSFSENYNSGGEQVDDQKDRDRNDKDYPCFCVYYQQVNVNPEPIDSEPNFSAFFILMHLGKTPVPEETECPDKYPVGSEYRCVWPVPKARWTDKISGKLLPWIFPPGMVFENQEAYMLATRTARRFLHFFFFLLSLTGCLGGCVACYHLKNPKTSKVQARENQNNLNIQEAAHEINTNDAVWAIPIANVHEEGLQTDENLTTPLLAYPVASQYIPYQPKSLPI